ncbi:uncharacterized protein LOC111674127 [Orussus abietinus]|uniref:uncharacterized protein LOC111674127 n=1 Tax=Orussus abietinus TaxID=222816 RepID=UPI000C715D6C|nr:uncharacterized protein LOC111674127 [Orussus abietinus]
MKEEIWTILYHKCSTNANPQYQNCPAGEASWCKWRKAEARGELTNFHHDKPPLTAQVQEVIKPVYEDLSRDELLARCLKAHTQNNNEPLNSLIWSFALKNLHSGTRIVDIVTFLAVIIFNEGFNGILKVLNALHCIVYFNRIYSHSVYLLFKEKRAKERQFHPPSNAKQALQLDVQKQEAQLNDIMKVDMIQDKNREEIIEIWQEYHKKKDCISGTMTAEQFDKMFTRGKKYSTFLLPLPRANGYEFIMSQFCGTEVHMTPLLWYQVHKENAPECLTMIHFTELKDSKNIVLVRGEFDANSLNVQEAQCLANELQLYYSMDDHQRLQLLQTFSERPDEFKHMDLIAQLETISLNMSKTSNVNARDAF